MPVALSTFYGLVGASCLRMPLVGEGRRGVDSSSGVAESHSKALMSANTSLVAHALFRLPSVICVRIPALASCSIVGAEVCLPHAQHQLPLTLPFSPCIRKVAIVTYRMLARSETSGRCLLEALSHRP